MISQIMINVIDSIATPQLALSATTMMTPPLPCLFARVCDLCVREHPSTNRKIMVSYGNFIRDLAMPIQLYRI